MKASESHFDALIAIESGHHGGKKSFMSKFSMSRTPHSQDPVESKITAGRKEGFLYSKGPGTMGTKLSDEPIASLRRGAVM